MDSLITWSPLPSTSLPSGRPRLRDVSLWFVLLTLAVTTMLHYLTDIHLIPYHSIYRSLYYLPIAVAAVRYGWRGGVAASLTASTLYIPHVMLSWSMMPADAFNDLLENVVFLFVGLLVGTIADQERVQRQRAQVAASDLATANSQLHAQAREAQRVEAFVAAILHSIDSGVLALDRAGTVTMTNRAALLLLGAHTPLTYATLPAVVRAYLEGGARGYQQVTLGERVLGLHGTPLLGLAHEDHGTVLVLDDLSALRSLEEQVQRAQRLAALGRLAGGLAHEIRNPLGIVRAAAQLLQPHLAAQPTHAEYARVITSEVDRVDRLIEQLLAYARPVPLQRGPIDLAAVVQRAVALTQVVAAQHAVTLDAAVAPLPCIDGDGELLHQALVNLLLNALQATPPGGRVCVVVMLAADPQGHEFVEVRVCDSGRGIAPADQIHIFDPFFTTRGDGTGLGLSIVQQIAGLHQGTITAESEPGLGTTMTLRLPALGAANTPG